MLRPEDPTLTDNPYGDTDPYAYPFAYREVDLWRDLGPYAGDPESGYAEVGLSPGEVLVGWARSLPGIQQSRQTARYDAVHAQLPLPNELGLPADSPEAQQLRVQTLERVARHIGSDMHPLGHMALTLRDTDEVLQHVSLPHRDPSTRPVALMRYAAATHDVGETLYPAVILQHGAALGDVPSGQKTLEDEVLESRIAHHLYEHLGIFKQAFDPSFRNDLVRFTRHETAALPDTATTQLHEVSEIVHRVGFLQAGIALHEASRESTDAVSMAIGRSIFRLSQNILAVNTPRLKAHLHGVPELRDYVMRSAGKLEDRLSGAARF